MANPLKFCLNWSLGLVAFLYCFVTAAQLTVFLSSQSRGVPDIRRYRARREANQETDDQTLWYLVVDCSLLLLFIVQHSAMATQCWKDTMEDWGLKVLDRAVYNIATGLVLQFLMFRWQVIVIGPLWFVDHAEHPILCLVFSIVHCLAWLFLYLTALTMDLPELIGVKQVYYDHLEFSAPMSLKVPGTQRLYRHMRHPGAICLLVIMWFHPVMTLDRLLLALTLTLYLLCGHSVSHQDYLYVHHEMVRKKAQLETRVVYHYQVE